MHRLPARSPALLRRTTLPDGTPIGLRSLRPSDQRALRAWFCQISPESRYLRLHGHVSDLPAALWRYLTTVDGQDHVAVVAYAGRRRARMVGVARLIRLVDHPDTAEVAFLVSDDMQRRGVGRLLLEALLASAQPRGIRAFHAHVLPSNHAVRRLLAVPALELVSESEGILHLLATRSG